jgi:hypothetical protein
MPRIAVGVKDGSVPSLAGGALWTDEINHVFYAFGGLFPDSSPTDFNTWSYNTKLDSWSVVPTQGQHPTYVAYGMGATAPDTGVGYYLGGYHDNQTQKGWRDGRLYTSTLVEFDMVDRRYSNTSGPDNRGRGEGIMVFIPASTSGLLIFLGGVTQDPTTRNVSGVSLFFFNYAD